MTVRTGGCLCGQVRFAMEGEPAATAVCHCRNCQLQAGSAMSIVVLTKLDNVSHTGDLKNYQDKGDSGNGVLRQFCPNCGSPIFSVIESMPGMVAVKAGTFDDTSWLQPQMHVWTKSAQDWVRVPDDIPSFATTPGG